MENIRKFYSFLNVEKKTKKIALLIFGLANLIALLFTRQWHLTALIAFILGNITLLVSMVYLLFLYQTSQHIDQVPEEKTHQFYRTSSIILTLAMLFVPFFFMVKVPFSVHNWDFFVLFENTSFLKGQPFDHLPATENQLLYFLRYPNNQFFAILQNTLFAKTTSVLAKIIWMTGLSSVLTTISAMAGSLTMKKLASEKLALLYNLAAFAFMPFYMYGAQFYTDTASIPFTICGLLFLVYGLQAKTIKKEILWYVLACLIMFFGYNIKPTVTFPLIALFGFFVLNKKWKKIALLLPIALLTFYGTHQYVKSVVSSDPAFTQAANNRYNLPLMHWVTMSFAPGNYSGGFDPAVLAYSEQFPSKAEKQAADIRLFQENLKKQGFFGIVSQLGRKISYTWLNGDLRDYFYTYQHMNPILYHYFDWMNEQSIGSHAGNILNRWGQSLLWFPLVFFMWYEIYLSLFKNWKTYWFILALSMIGLTGFLLIWEANSRYLYNFAPIMIILAVKGLMDYSNMRRQKKGIGLKNEVIK